MTEPTRLTCPACGRYIGTIEGARFEAVPCRCGWQTTVKRTSQKPMTRRDKVTVG